MARVSASRLPEAIRVAGASYLGPVTAPAR